MAGARGFDFAHTLAPGDRRGGAARAALATSVGLVCFLVLCGPAGVSAGACSALGDCNSHGICVAANETCQCYDGWGSESDVSHYKQADCSQRVCPSDKAWFDVPTAATTAHAVAECSNAGVCIRSTGKCDCFDGYDGDACQRLACPNDCSGHGKCVSISTYQTEQNAMPAQPNSFSYGGSEATTTWDENKIYACVCDSSWAVGLADDETQLAEWFGTDCSKRRCPSGDDPMTTADETDCEDKKDNGATDDATATGGDAGNLCHVECANRGICDYDTGKCKCFPGFYGLACTLQDALAGYN